MLSCQVEELKFAVLSEVLSSPRASEASLVGLAVVVFCPSPVGVDTVNRFLVVDKATDPRFTAGFISIEVQKRRLDLLWYLIL